MSSPLLDWLPNELLVKIFTHTRLIDMVTCKQVCRRLRDIIQDSLLLRCKTELDVEGFQDVAEDISTDVKLARLDAYKQFWEAGHGKFTTRFTYPGAASTPLCAISSTLLAYVRNDSQVNFIQIPSEVFDIPARQWELPPFPYTISKLAIDQSQELLVILTLPNAAHQDIRVYFLHTETGEKHPKAAVPYVCCPLSNEANIEGNPTIQIFSRMVAVSCRTTVKEHLGVIKWEQGTFLVDVFNVTGDGIAVVDERYIVSTAYRDHKFAGALLVLDTMHPPPLGFDFSNTSVTLPHPPIALDLPPPPTKHKSTVSGLWTTCAHSHVRAPSAPIVQRTDEDILALYFWFDCDATCRRRMCEYSSIFPPRRWLVVPKPALLQVIERSAALPGSAEWASNVRHVPWQSWGAGTCELETYFHSSSFPAHGSRLAIHDLSSNADTDFPVFIHDFRRLPLRRSLALPSEDDQTVCGADQPVPHRRALPPRPPGVEDGPYFVLAMGDYFIHGVELSEGDNELTFYTFSV